MKNGSERIHFLCEVSPARPDLSGQSRARGLPQRSEGTSRPQASQGTRASSRARDAPRTEVFIGREHTSSRGVFPLLDCAEV